MCSAAFSRVRELQRADVRSYRTNRRSATMSLGDRRLSILADVAACAADAYVAGLRHGQQLQPCPCDTLLAKGFAPRRRRSGGGRRRSSNWDGAAALLDPRSASTQPMVHQAVYDVNPLPPMAQLQPGRHAPPAFVSLPPGNTAAAIQSIWPFLHSQLPADLSSVQQPSATGVQQLQGMLWAA